MGSLLAQAGTMLLTSRMSHPQPLPYPHFKCFVMPSPSRFLCRPQTNNAFQIDAQFSST